MKKLKEIGKYKIIKELEPGYFGDVFLVKDRALGTKKVIKVLDIKNPNQFKQKLEEAQILEKCRHKHIVRINAADIYKVNNKPKVILDLEYMTGGSLEKMIKKRFISLKETIGHFIQVLSGLEHAHNQGFLHRDIKPGNILLGRNITKLSDFGMATEYGLDFCGSPQGYRSHLPPEVYKTHETSISSDIFAVGITLFRVSNNISDWWERLEDLTNYQNSIKRGSLIKELKYQGYIPQKLKRVINRACNRDPKKRFKSAFEMSQRLVKLRVNLDWKRKNNFKWEGFKNEDFYNLDIIEKRSGFEVIFKKNGRKKGNHCRKLKYLEEAQLYVNKMIAETTFVR